MNTSSHTIALEGLSKHFGDVTAVDHIDLEVAPGESLVVLGPSGSGKSTLLRLIAGLEPPTSGKVIIGGREQSGIPTHERDIAIVFQHFALYPHLSARKNITMGLIHGLKIGKAEATRRAEDVATMLGIDHLLDRRPREMSGGQRQRVALARAMARHSSVVLLDEPLSGLDAQLHLSLRLEISRRLRDIGATHLMVTHDQADAMATADRIAVMHNGRIEQLGTPDDVYHRPATLFVAGFVGSPPMNLLHAERRDEGFVSPLGVVRGPNSENDITLGIRPENIIPGGADTWNFKGRVLEIEHEGSSRILDVELGGPVIRVRVPADYTSQRDAVIPLHCDPRHVSVFDTKTGLNMGTAAEWLKEQEPLDA
ncbi:MULTISPECIES: ABC transporter ATP-binding protein [Nesterenkonia]|uniref:ABC transporter ATP-binding protein n=1 Tax=Nesterenkonia flava TaxID=469799 RepID=A0ABU1FRR4_9MICC|nr:MULTISPECIES: ABC transporter ATP-binding protein [Nesterenkonia]MDR5710853.1 ABC transporter ATP-binding protein [Nesterenkonia flava]